MFPSRDRERGTWERRQPAPAVGCHIFNRALLGIPSRPGQIPIRLPRIRSEIANCAVTLHVEEREIVTLRSEAAEVDFILEILLFARGSQ